MTSACNNNTRWKKNVKVDDEDDDDDSSCGGAAVAEHGRSPGMQCGICSEVVVCAQNIISLAPRLRFNYTSNCSNQWSSNVTGRMASSNGTDICERATEEVGEEPSRTTMSRPATTDALAIRRVWGPCHGKRIRSPDGTGGGTLRTRGSTLST